ncbi:SAM-dependent methyltransferase [Actinoplanes awajinensis]|uniref:Methyltransferase n=1 Tax=Actinoplanes awajinensis subsp. mycoplanecinus TaxID=135947 RepID=A0A117MKH0_9ACTN|nr:SAM-dependent methyltransferase [Actinoplanes awajinensis]KUL22362.1 methyltransferase [Actinoplanes awajinensis subsp. mycoplanecinus]
MDEVSAAAAGLAPEVAHPARRYDYWLGGADNFAADRASGDELERLFPKVRLGALANRALLGRATRFLAAEAGIRQFLDIGTGLPTAGNTHAVAQRWAPDSRVVYVDNDPLVTVHARALLDSAPEGRTAYLEADLNDPESILADPVLNATLDLGQPVGLMLIAVLHFLHGDGAAEGIVRRLLTALPPGSYLVATHATSDFGTPEQQALYRQLVEQGKSDVWTRGRDEFTGLFDGLELVDPGVVPASEWRPEPGAEIPPRSDINIWTAVGRKP